MFKIIRSVDIKFEPKYLSNRNISVFEMSTVDFMIIPQILYEKINDHGI